MYEVGGVVNQPEVGVTLVSVIKYPVTALLSVAVNVTGTLSDVDVADGIVKVTTGLVTSGKVIDMTS